MKHPSDYTQEQIDARIAEWYDENIVIETPETPQGAPEEVDILPQTGVVSDIVLLLAGIMMMAGGIVLVKKYN